MPELTGIEKTLVARLRSNACLLQNGKRGDLHTMSDCVADSAAGLAALIEAGGPTWKECKEFRDSIKRSFIDWKATLVICGTIFGIVWKVIG